MIKKILIALAIPIALDIAIVYFIKRALDEVEFTDF